MNGLELIKHTVGGGVMTASGTGAVRLVKNGKIEFTDATEINVDQCFSATYDNYLVVGQISCSSSESLIYRLRKNGNLNTTANAYVTQVIYADNTTVGGARTTADYGRAMGAFNTTTNGLHFYMYGPNLPQPTAARSVVMSSHNGAYIVDYASTHNQSTDYDGLTFYTFSNGPTFTGSLTIYGFTKGTTP